MDVKQYAAVTDVCARLAGRIEDSTLRSVRMDYAGGESYLAEAALLLMLAHENIGITQEEHDLLLSTVDERNLSDLEDVPIIAEAPPLQYSFSSKAPSGAPDPGQADAMVVRLLAGSAARRLRRAWRQPLGEGEGTWIYVVQVADGTDTLSIHSGLASSLWVELKETWPIEVVVEGKPQPPYQAAALAVAPQIWSA